MKTNVITFIAIIGLAVWLALHVSSVEWTGVKIVGGVIAVVGLVLLLTARIQLGRSFSVGAKARKLVTTGLYSRIRNPIYVFAARFRVGLAIVLGSWWLAIFVAVLMLVQVYRARKEEAVLAAAFGEEYARYKAGTWF
jgi:protein-S-isoprenylcysteine O-methyltransferase Ste14